MQNSCDEELVSQNVVINLHMDFFTPGVKIFHKELFTM